MCDLQDQFTEVMCAASVVKVSLLVFAGPVLIVPMSTCVVSAMELTNILLHISLSGLTGSLLTGKSFTLHLLPQQREID